MKYTYSLSHLDFLKLNSRREVLKMLKEHDEDTFLFSVRTAQFNLAICKEMNMDKEKLRLYFLCGLYHDTGKLGMTSEFLNFPGAYTIDMYNEMKKHTAGGAFILEKVNAEKELIENCKHHHSNFDGTGYPGGFFNNEIPLYARITRVSDSVDAYMTKRCYKEGGPAREALADLNQYIGTSYDPEVLEFFSIVHAKVMRLCHKNGLDHPSQEIYMHYLNEIYNPEHEFEKDELKGILY